MLEDDISMPVSQQLGHPSSTGCPATKQREKETERQAVSHDFGSVEAEQQKNKKRLKVTQTHNILGPTPSSGMQLIVGVVFN